MNGPPRESLAPDYFERMYRADADPWRFAASPYEASKYAATLAALPHQRYANALEIGCSIGVLTEKLAVRCDALLSLDVSPTAMQQAQARCAHLPRVQFALRQVPKEFPEGTYDLVLVSEVGYYLAMPDLLTLKQQLLDSLTPGGHLLLVHWTPYVDDYPLTGDQVHEVFLQSTPSPLQLLHSAREPQYRLDLFERV